MVTEETNPREGLKQTNSELQEELSINKDMTGSGYNFLLKKEVTVVSLK